MWRLEQSFTHRKEIALQTVSMTLIKVQISHNVSAQLNILCSIAAQVLYSPVSEFHWCLVYCLIFSVTTIRHCDQGNVQKGVYLDL